MNISPLYLRREPTTDPVLLKYEPEAKRLDVVAYYDRECQNLAGRWPWHYESRPDRRNRYIMLNCARRPVEWLPDADKPSRFGFPIAPNGLVLTYKGLQRVA